MPRPIIQSTPPIFRTCLLTVKCRWNWRVIEHQCHHTCDLLGCWQHCPDQTWNFAEVANCQIQSCCNNQQSWLWSIRCNVQCRILIQIWSELPVVLTFAFVPAFVVDELKGYSLPSSPAIWKATHNNQTERGKLSRKSVWGQGMRRMRDNG